MKNVGYPPDLSRQSHAGACEDWWASCNHRDHISDQTANAFKFLLNKIGKSCREHLAVTLYGCLSGKLLCLYYITLFVFDGWGEANGSWARAFTQSAPLSLRLLCLSYIDKNMPIIKSSMLKVFLRYLLYATSDPSWLRRAARVSQYPTQTLFEKISPVNCRICVCRDYTLWLYNYTDLKKKKVQTTNSYLK